MSWTDGESYQFVVRGQAKSPSIFMRSWLWPTPVGGASLCAHTSGSDSDAVSLYANTGVPTRVRCNYLPDPPVAGTDPSSVPAISITVNLMRKKMATKKPTNEQTSARVASTASKLLSNPRTSAAVKSVAASALTQKASAGKSKSK